MAEQKILSADNDYKELDEYLKAGGHKRILLVCGSSIKYLKLDVYFQTLERRTGIKVVRFSGFNPNPLYESVAEGVKLFRSADCSMIIAVGGGSAIDTAKCIKLYSNMDDKKNYLEQKIIPNETELVAIPTTAGTGSEATRFAVIYYNGEKQSVSDDSCIPAAALMDASLLETLPVYQKKAAMLDAFCHALESFWSVNSTKESRQYAKEAIQLILTNMDGYLAGQHTEAAQMLQASNLAGKAINISQTTAGHAMCYKLTSLYKIAHGHAAALCVRKLWPYMIENIDNCTDPRGRKYLQNIFQEMAETMGYPASIEAAGKFHAVYDKLGLSVPAYEETDINILKASVNPVRLKNNPVALTENDIEILYRQILRKEEKLL